MNPKAKKIVFDITSLRVQGASQVQKAGVNALYYTALQSKAKTLSRFRKELQKTGIALLQSRFTEPNLRSVVQLAWKAGNTPAVSVEEARKHVVRECAELEKNWERAKKTIAEKSRRLFPRNAVIFTHCHSNTVEAVLKKARKRIEMVYCTETRPLFQGRITATNLSKVGIPVTQIVDSSAASFIGKADLLVTGADAILANGNVINKIGTNPISLLAQKHQVPHLVFSSFFSFDPLTCFGWKEPIEERDWKEVWPNKPARVKIKNPAFDETPARQIKKIVSQLGALSPEKFVQKAKKELRVQKNRKNYFEILKAIGR